MGYEEYALFRLGAEPVVSYSNAGRSMLYNLEAGAWDGDLLQACGISSGKLPRLCPSGQYVGVVNHRVADELGLPSDVRLVSGGFDQACCALGCGTIGENQVQSTIGTNGILFFSVDASSKEKLFQHAMSFTPHVLPGRWCTFTQITGAGGALRWFRDRFYDKPVSYEAICCTMPEEPTGLLFLPFLSGAGTPEMNTEARGAIWGLTLETDRARAAKSILEGVCYELSWQLDLIHRISGVTPRELTCVGGAANSAAWMQLKADITGLPVRCLKGWEPGTAGAAILAGTGSRQFSDMEEGSARISVSAKASLLFPDKNRTMRYAEWRDRYKAFRDQSFSFQKDPLTRRLVF